MILEVSLRSLALVLPYLHAKSTRLLRTSHHDGIHNIICHPLPYRVSLVILYLKTLALSLSVHYPELGNALLVSYPFDEPSPSDDQTNHGNTNF